MGFEDWESKSAYLVKKYFETSLDALCENNTTGTISGILCIEERDSNSPESIECRRQAEERIEKIYALISHPKFFTERQKQVLSLSLGWIGGRYVGCKNVSEISRILKLSQPVVFNHYKLIIKKLQKHFDSQK